MLEFYFVDWNLISIFLLSNYKLMKILLSILFISTSLFVFSQVSYPLSKYPMYSKIWKMYYDKDEQDEDGLPLIVFAPKSNERTFGDKCDAMKNVDQTKVQSYLITELNNFRKDYNKKSIKKNQSLTYKSVTDAKKLTTNKDYQLKTEKGVKTVYDRIPVDFFSRVDTKKYNLEKIIAESVFDWFVANDTGMSLLLSEKRTEFGVGVYISESSGVTIVIRGK